MKTWIATSWALAVSLWAIISFAFWRQEITRKVENRLEEKKNGHNLTN